MEVREFRPEDEGPLLELWHRCGLVRPQNDPHRDVQRKLGTGPELFLVGVLDGRVVASAMAGYEGHRGWLNYVAVDPELQRRGLGRQLVEEAERRLGRLGCPKVNLQVRRTNDGALRFWERMGYVVDDVVSFGKRLEHDRPRG